MSSDYVALHKRAARLFAEIGCHSEIQLSSLRAGGNNRVYRLKTSTGVYVLKEYFRHHGDNRDRLEAEFSFASFAWANGIRCIPEPIARDDEEGLGLYSFLDGERIESETVSNADIKQAIDFVASLNRFRETPKARKLPNGSEACFTLQQHLDLLEKRLDRLKNITAGSHIDYHALAFVSAKLKPAYSQLSIRIRESLVALNFEAAAELPLEERIISPSDFGFHNALRRPDGRIAFFDFEYAGWDDPAKMTGDFFSQVAVPVSLLHEDFMLNAVADMFPNRDSALIRMQLLLPLYRIKWCCILLNHFLPVDSTRRAFAQGIAEDHKTKQLAKAESLLSSIDQFNI